MIRSLFCAAALAMSGFASAQAASLSQPREAVVHYDDVNVRQPAGAQVLLARIDAAAHDVCGPTPDMRDLTAWHLYRNCVRTSTDHAVASLPFDVMANLNSDGQTIAQR